MSKRVLHIRHTKASADAFVGKPGEFTMDLTTKSIRAHDGLTKGGTETARADLENTPDATAATPGRMSAAQALALQQVITQAAENGVAIEQTGEGSAGSVATESARAKAAEASLSSDIQNTQAGLNNEASARVAADANLQSQINAINGNAGDLFALIYPVGTVYQTTRDINPRTLFGVGSWKQLPQGHVTLSQGGIFPAGSTGGQWDPALLQHSHTFIGSTMPGHRHTASKGSAVQNPAGVLQETIGTSYLIEQSDANTSSVSAGVPEGQITAAGEGVGLQNLPPYVALYIWERVS